MLPPQGEFSIGANALLHTSAGKTTRSNASLPGLSSPIGDPTSLVDPSAPLIDNPFAALMDPSGLKFSPMTQLPHTQLPKPKPVLQKALPLIHLISVWCLLAYFVLFVEPKTYAQANVPVLGAGTEGSLKRDSVFLWRRWSELAQGQTLGKGLTTFRLQIVVNKFFSSLFTCRFNVTAFFLGFHDARNHPPLIAFLGWLRMSFSPLALICIKPRLSRMPCNRLQ